MIIATTQVHDKENDSDNRNDECRDTNADSDTLNKVCRVTGSLPFSSVGVPQ
jgi:hypothetical protein